MDKNIHSTKVKNESSEPGVSPTGARQRDSLLDLTVTSSKTQITTKDKVVVSGSILEHYHYETPIATGRDNSKHRKLKKQPKRKLHDRTEEYKRRRLQRAKGRVKRYANKNFTKLKKTSFLTLTFENGLHFDINNLQETNKRKATFLKKLKSKYSNIKYLGIAEFQKRGAVHYHLLVELPFIKKETLDVLWGWGFTDIRRIDNIDNIGAYLVKYMTKDLLDERFKNNRLFFKSNNLAEPTTYYGQKAEYILNKLKQQNYYPTFTSQYETERNGVATYREFNLRRSNDLRKST